MNKWTHIIAMIIFTMFCAISKAQNMENIVIENIDGGLDTLKYELRLQRYIFKDKALTLPLILTILIMSY